MGKGNGSTRASGSRNPNGISNGTGGQITSGPFKGMRLGEAIPSDRYDDQQKEYLKMWRSLQEYGEKNGYLNGVVGTFVPVTNSERGYYQAVIEVERRGDGALDMVVPYFRISDLQPHGLRDFFGGSETEAQKTRDMKFKTVEQAVAYAKKEALRINKKYKL